MHVTATSYFLGSRLDARWQEGLASSREQQESRALWLRSQQPESSIFLTIGRHGIGVLFFLHCRAVATAEQ